VKQEFAVFQQQDIATGGEKIRQVTIVEPMNSVGVPPETREDGVLPTMLLSRVFVSYQNQFAILDPR
jgi:hypothetical protein